jgi:hypothetical protein
VRFILDENISSEVARICRGLGVDVVGSAECDRNYLSDDEQLRLAAEDGRCIITYNRRDFSHLTFQSMADGLLHAGVVLVPKSLPNDRFGDLAQAISRFDFLHPEGLPPYALDYLTK